MKCAKGAKGFWPLSRRSVAIAFQTLTPHNTHGLRARFNLEAGAFAGFVEAVYGVPFDKLRVRPAQLGMRATSPAQCTVSTAWRRLLRCAGDVVCPKREVAPVKPTIDNSSE